MKIVIIGLDSASWNVLMPMIEAGTLPTIGRYIKIKRQDSSLLYRRRKS